MNPTIAPSMLSADFGRLGEELQAIENAGVTYLHVDVMDGVFVPSISFGMPVIKSIRKNTDLFFDVHLMIVDPIRYIDDFVKSGADGITFHLEAAEDADAVIEAIRNADKKVGISIKPGTPFEAVIPYMDKVDMLLIMTVEPGFGGQKYIEDMTKKIAEARKYIDENGLPVVIEVDGGINDKTGPLCLKAGCDYLVAGSFFYHSLDKSKALVSLRGGLR